MTIPANVVAKLSIAGSAVAAINESGRAVVGDPGVTNARAANGTVVLTVGSGHYAFASSPPSAGGSGSSSGAKTIAIVLVPVALVAVAAAITLARRRRAP